MADLSDYFVHDTCRPTRLPSDRHSLAVYLTFHMSRRVLGMPCWLTSVVERDFGRGALRRIAYPHNRLTACGVSLCKACHACAFV